MKQLKSLSVLDALLATTLVLSGCGKDNVTNPLAGQPTGTSASAQDDFSAEVGAKTVDNETATGLFNFGVARILFVHASPDAPAVDIRIDRQLAARSLAFPKNTPYRYTFSGDRRVTVNVAGTATTVIDAPVTLNKRTFYSVFAVNNVANIEPIVLVDDLSAPARGKAHVRFLHLSPNAPEVDIAVANGGPVVFGNYVFKEASPFTPLDAGTYDLEVRLAGTGTVVLPLPGIKFDAGKIYTVFAKGLVGGSGAQALGAQIIVNSEERRWPFNVWGGANLARMD